MVFFHARVLHLTFYRKPHGLMADTMLIIYITMDNTNRMCLVLLAALLMASCGGATRTPPPIAPVENIEELLSTLPPLLHPDELSKDSRGCYIPDQEHVQYISLEDGLCLVYPGNFKVLEAADKPGLVSYTGPERQGVSGPIQATLTIQIHSAGERTLEQAIDALVESYSGTNLLRTNVKIDGQPAEILEGVPGQVSTRQALTLVNERVFTLTLTPSGEDYPTAMADANQIWVTALSTMHFFAPGFSSTPSGRVDTSEWAVQEFTGIGITLLMPPNWQLNPQSDAFAMAPRDNPIPTWIALRGLPDLPASDLASLTEAIKSRIQEQGVPYGEITSRDFNGLMSVIVKGKPGLCQDIYVPAFDLVHQIAVHADLCSQDGSLVDDEAKAILDSIRFIEATQ